MKTKILWAMLISICLVGIVIAQVFTTTDSTITLDKKYADIVKGTYVVGNRTCSATTCSETVNGKYINIVYETPRYVCEGVWSADCIKKEKTDAEITAGRDKLVKRLLEGIARSILDNVKVVNKSSGGTITVK